MKHWRWLLPRWQDVVVISLMGLIEVLFLCGIVLLVF